MLAKKGIRKGLMNALHAIGLYKTADEIKAIKERRAYLKKKKLEKIRTEEKEQLEKITAGEKEKLGKVKAEEKEQLEKITAEEKGKYLLFKKKNLEAKYEEERRKTEELLGKKEKSKETREAEKQEARELNKNLREGISASLNRFLTRAVQEGYSRQKIKSLLVSRGWPKEFTDEYCDNFFEMMVSAKTGLSLQEQLSHISEKLEGNVEYLKKLPEKWAEIKPVEEKQLIKKPWHKELMEKKQKAQEESQRRLKALQEQLSLADEELERNVEHLQKLPEKWTVLKSVKEKLPTAKPAPKEFIEQKQKVQEESGKKLKTLQEQLESINKELENL